ncbi:uncharacterized protein LOC134764020 [Penaeus indicus]|uniref:uncharacterized protein LOC134764020 n=1 Tax=Penaeus indicus TaxID=29960 RepID=UPI00300C5216
MAPIPHSCDLKVSARDAKPCEREEPSKGRWDVALPISRRGSFFQDSFFSDVHDEFDATIRRVLGRWRDADLSLRDRWDDSCRYNDILKRYRQLRSLNLREEDQAVTVTTDTSAHKIVVDVHDFLDGEVKVKVVGEKEVVVEGRVERREGGGSSAHSFRRRFSLPHFTDMSAITSVMSSDGILTITAPKQEQQSHQRTTIIPIKLEEVENSVLSRTTDNNDTSSAENTCEKSQKLICETVKNNNETINIPSHAKEVPTVNSLQPRSVEIQISKERINDDVCEVRRQENNVKTTERTQSDAADESSQVCKELDSTGLERSRQGFWDELLPITRRGSFFQDSFFSDMHQKFDAAIKKVLNRWSTNDLEWTDTGNDVGLRYKDILQRYRELRSRHLEQNLAVTVTSDKTGHKIVMDVHEFTDGKVKVRVVGERELVVEGSAEKKAEGNSAISSHSFRRRFSLPRQTDMAAITSVMSSDGILTITAPKVECLEESKEMSGNRRLSKEEESRDAKRPLCIKKSESSATENVCFPLTKMGLFFHDSFFKDSTEEFRKAVREILTRWGEASPEVDDLTRYRILRSRDSREETQAVTSLEDDRHHKFVIDVHDFVDGGEVSVKAVNERELVVEGQLEKKGDGSRSSKRFLRRFVVPGDIELEAVTSVTSSDGVLTISAPKKKPLLKLTNETQKRDTKEAKNTNQKANEFSSNETSLCSSEKCQRKESIVPIQLENKEEVAVPVVHEGNTADALVSADKVEQKHSSADLMSPTSDDDDDEGYTFIVRQPGNSYRVTFGDDEESHAWKRDSSLCDPESKYALKSSGFDCVNRNLPIVRKGLFADDCCFENVRHKYSQAVREVLEKANEWSCRSEAMGNYRKLRQQKVNLENQAVGVSEDSESHKIVMDVFDFISGDVTVRLVEGKELLVEGQAEKQDGSRVSRVSFVRRFALPELVDRDAISCVLSSDGILTVISRKKGKAHGERDQRRSPQ